MSNRYRDWTPTIDAMKGHSNLESQVMADIHKILSPSKEVLDRLVGEEEIDQELRSILQDYRARQWQDAKSDLTASLTGKLLEIGAPILQHWFETLLTPPPIVMPFRRAMPSPSGYSSVNQI
jgi:hypothetical protein